MHKMNHLQFDYVFEIGECPVRCYPTGIGVGGTT